MKMLVALLMVVAQVAPAQEVDRLEQALVHLRKQVVFVDLSTDGKLISWGKTATLSGISGVVSVGLGGGLEGAGVGLKVFGTGLFVTSLGAVGVGATMLAFGSVRRMMHPRQKMVVATPRDYILAEGLNEYMSLDPPEQLRLARETPELAAFVIKISDAFDLAQHYKLLPAESQPDYLLF